MAVLTKLWQCHFKHVQQILPLVEPCALKVICTHKYEGRPRFFSVQYHRATLDYSSRVERSSSGLGTSQKPRLSYLDQDFSSGTFYKRVWKCHFGRRGRRTWQATCRWMVILYTATTSVGWWKNFSVNVLLISGGSSSILLSLGAGSFTT